MVAPSYPLTKAFDSTSVTSTSTLTPTPLSSLNCPLTKCTTLRSSPNQPAIMVKFRGIDVTIVSQFDIRKLPEFKPRESDDAINHNEPALRSNDNSIASCYTPLYPGSQIWFEYSIDGPHPPQAAYFFKLLHNGQTVTSWDCTAKHGYHGKTTYNIQYIGNDNFTGMPLVKRQAFKFSPQSLKEVGAFDDCIEVRVHRIEHRQKVPLEESNVPYGHISGKVDKGAGLW